MALSYWPWSLLESPATTKENPKPVISLCKLRMSLCLAALAVVLRPTNALIWLPVVGTTLFKALPRSSISVSSPAAVLIREAIICGSLIVGLSLLADRTYFGFWTFPPFNWLNFNITKSLAVFYGRNPWHYYILQGIPLLCTTSLPLVLQALYAPQPTAAYQTNILRTLAAAVYITLLALSLISHKEVRFIYPLLPTLNVLAAPYTTSFFTAHPTKPPRTYSKVKTSRPTLRNKPYLIAALAVNALLAGYLSYFHQSAPLSVLNFLRTDYSRVHPPSSSPNINSNELFALFLMPCHSTPWRSHLIHPSLQAYALSCNPPLHTQPNTRERAAYRDEADRFYDNPVTFLSDEMFTEYAYADFAPGPTATKPSLVNLPRYIVGFEGVEAYLEQFLTQTNTGRASGMRLRRVWSAWNGLFHEDWRRAGRIVVWDTGVFGDALPEERLE
jgi:phosphatidylinositol glycan class B